MQRCEIAAKRHKILADGISQAAELVANGIQWNDLLPWRLLSGKMVCVCRKEIVRTRGTKARASLGVSLWGVYRGTSTGVARMGVSVRRMFLWTSRQTSNIGSGWQSPMEAVRKPTKKRWEGLNNQSTLKRRQGKRKETREKVRKRKENPTYASRKLSRPRIAEHKSTF